LFGNRKRLPPNYYFTTRLFVCNPRKAHHIWYCTKFQEFNTTKTAQLSAQERRTLYNRSFGFRGEKRYFKRALSTICRSRCCPYFGCIGASRRNSFCYSLLYLQANRLYEAWLSVKVRFNSFVSLGICISRRVVSLCFKSGYYVQFFYFGAAF